MSATTWIKFYPSDWLNGTVTLTPVERGVYITLIALMYDQEGPLENVPRILSRRCGMTVAQFNAVLESLIEQGKLTLEDGSICNEKVARILGDVFARKERASKGGHAKAERKAQQNQGNDPAAADDKQEPSTACDVLEQPPSNAIPDTRSQIKKASKLAKEKRGEVQPESQGPDAILEADLRHAAGWHHDAPRLSHVKPIADLIAQGLSLHDDVIPTVRQLAVNVKHPTSWVYFVKPLEDILRRRKGEVEPDKPAKPEAPATPPRKVWVWKDSPQWQAWQATRKDGRSWPTSELSHPAGGRRPGWYFDTEWPPGAEPVQAA